MNHRLRLVRTRSLSLLQQIAHQRDIYRIRNGFGKINFLDFSACSWGFHISSFWMDKCRYFSAELLSPTRQSVYLPMPNLNLNNEKSSLTPSDKEFENN